jgi:hypothetical protein
MCKMENIERTFEPVTCATKLSLHFVIICMTMYEWLRLAQEDTALLITSKLQIISVPSISSLTFTFNAPGIFYSNVNILNIVKELIVQNVVIVSMCFVCKSALHASLENINITNIHNIIIRLILTKNINIYCISTILTDTIWPLTSVFWQL